MGIKEAYQQALLSEASYADLQTAKNPDGSFNTDRIKTALMNTGGTGKGFSEAQASDFVTHWKVANHQPDTASGFSATLFESLDNPGTYTLAIRGTLGVIDLAEDIFGIAAQGVASAQAVDLYRYYKQLTTPAGQAINYSQGELLLLAGLTDGNYSPLTTTANYLSIVARTGNDQGLGALPAGTAIDVTGHSLGGHLAMLFTQMFPAVVDQVTTYNGAGLGGIASQILDLAGFNVDVPNSRVSNIVADGGLDLTAGVGYVIGSSQRVFIEESSNPLDNHRIGRLTDALAVYNLLGSLNPALTLADLTPVLAAGSNMPNESLENIVNAMGDLFGAGVEVGIDNRDELYTRIQAIQATLPAAPGFALTALTDDTPSSLAVAARSDKGFLYALEQLNPFAIVGDDTLYAGLDPADFSDIYLNANCVLYFTRSLCDARTQQGEGFLT